VDLVDHVAAAQAEAVADTALADALDDHAIRRLADLDAEPRGCTGVEVAGAGRRRLGGRRRRGCGRRRVATEARQRARIRALAQLYAHGLQLAVAHQLQLDGLRRCVLADARAQLLEVLDRLARERDDAITRAQPRGCGRRPGVDLPEHG